MTLPELLTEFRISFRHAGESPHVTQGWLGVECPFCGKDTGKFGLGINLEYGNCSCWKCGSKRLKEVLPELTGRPWREIWPLLKGVEFRRDRQERVRGTLALPEGTGPLHAAHRHYLQVMRKLDPNEMIRLWGLLGTDWRCSRLGWRIVIPIHRHGEIVSWTARSIGITPTLKYITARPEEESVPAKSLLLGEDYARHAVVVVEGPFDVFQVGPGAVATLGVSYSPAQVARLARYPVRAVVFDNEREAQNRARKLCEELSCHPGRTVRVELDAADPGGASPREIARLRREFLD